MGRRKIDRALIHRGAAVDGARSRTARLVHEPRGVDRVEFVGQPDFEACQMFIALREQSVVLQQAAQMINMSAGPCSGEAAVGQWYCAGGDSAEQLQYLGVAFPGQDAFGSVDATEYFDQCLHGGEVRGLVQQDFAQVLAKGAAGALARAVDLAFAMAGFASEVAGDTGAAQANRSRVSAILAARRTPSYPQAGQMPWVRIAA